MSVLVGMRKAADHVVVSEYATSKLRNIRVDPGIEDRDGFRRTTDIGECCVGLSSNRSERLLGSLNARGRSLLGLPERHSTIDLGSDDARGLRPTAGPEPPRLARGGVGRVSPRPGPGDPQKEAAHRRLPR